jgi:phosphatidylglycerophosphate synthase
MRRVARLTAPPAGDSFARVAGMSVLLRQLLSLQDAGISEVVIEGLPAKRLPVDRRLRLTVRTADSVSAEPATLRARLGLVWHRDLPRRLIQVGYQGDLEAAPRDRDEFLIAADTPANCQAAETRLLKSLLKATDGLISRAINRRVSLQVTRVVLHTELSPNQMTLVAAIFGAAAIAAVAAGGVSWLIPGAILLQIQSILDGCDGELSRLKYIRSRLGEWLDQVLDDGINLGYFVAVGWSLARAGSGLMVPVTIAGAAMHVVYQIALYTALITRGGGSGSVASIRWAGQLDPHADRPERSPTGVLRAFKETVEIAGRRDFFTFFYLPAALLGLSEIAVWWCAIIFVSSGVMTTLDWLLRGGPRPVQRPS